MAGGLSGVGITTRCSTCCRSAQSHFLYQVGPDVARGHFVAIAFHPWILAEEPDRMPHWEEWLDGAVNAGARVGALEDLLPTDVGSKQ